MQIPLQLLLFSMMKIILNLEFHCFSVSRSKDTESDFILNIDSVILLSFPKNVPHIFQLFCSTRVTCPTCAS